MVRKIKTKYSPEGPRGGFWGYKVRGRRQNSPKAKGGLPQRERIGFSENVMERCEVVRTAAVKQARMSDQTAGGDKGVCIALYVPCSSFFAERIHVSLGSDASLVVCLVLFLFLLVLLSGINHFHPSAK